MKFLLKAFSSLIILLLVSCGSSSSSSDSTQVEQDTLRPKVGLAILGLLNPRFPVQDALELLSITKRPAFLILHNTFGSNPQNLISLVDSLRKQGKAPVIGVYALCGPCRIPRRDGKLVSFKREYDIDALNYALVNNEQTREDYRNYLVDMKNNIISLYNDLEYRVYPELESNMTYEAQQVAISIMKDVFSDMNNVFVIVNPLNNQRHSNERLEVHTEELNVLQRLNVGDIISLDGQHLNFRNESHLSGPTFEDMKFFVQASINKGVEFYLWRHEWQGLVRDATTSPDPNSRSYNFTNKDEIKELLLLE